MKKYYHMTSLESIRAISNIGLVPTSGEKCKLINHKDEKVCFSEGMTGTVAMYATCYKKYTLVKSDVNVNIDEETADRIKKSEDINEFLGEGVYIAFDGTEIENETNFMNGVTSTSVDSEKLTICVLRETKTNKVYYLRNDVINFMMSKVPAETIKYSGKDLDTEKAEKQNQVIIQDVNKYVEAHKSEIEKYRVEDYQLEYMPIKDFCMQYLFQVGDSMSGQALGKATMDLLKDVEKVMEMEAQLDKDVRELSRDTIEQDHTLIPKEHAERKKEDENSN